MTEVIMPKMGDAMEEGILVEWLKKDGEKVKSGEVIGTIQTDKATLELESPGSGILSGLLVNGGDTVPVGKPIAAVLKEGEKLPSGWGSSNGASHGAAVAPVTPDTKDLTATVEPAPDTRDPITAGGESGRIKASPLAKKVAESKGIDLRTVTGTGPGGRIVEKDVQSAKPAAAAVAAVAAAPADTIVKLNRIRQITAQRTSESMQQAPHFYVTVEVDVERIMELREMFEAEGGGKLSVNDFVIRACVLALQQMPQVNASFQGDSIKLYGAVHMGLAVALEDGLTVPVLRNAHGMTLRQLSSLSKELSGKARENKLSPEELSGSTFTISNMGMLGVDQFTAIINQPNAAILAVASAKKTPVVNADDELDIRYRMKMTASFDHRVVDGAVGAKFLNVVREYLENPTRLLS